MIKFNNSQLEAFRSQRLDSFVQNTIVHLRSKFFGEAEKLSNDELDALIRKARERGERYAVTSAYDVRRLSECLLLYGDDFCESAETDWAGNILARENTSGREKMTAISDYEVFVLRPGK